MKKFFLPAALAAIILIVVTGTFLVSKPPDQTSTIPLPTSLEYFWGDGCPHCADVEEFLASWGKRDEVKIDKMEVWKNPNNAKKMFERGNYCQIPQNELGVPFLFTPEGKCIIGDAPLIQFFKELD